MFHVTQIGPIRDVPQHFNGGCRYITFHFSRRTRRPDEMNDANDDDKNDSRDDDHFDHSQRVVYNVTT